MYKDLRLTVTADENFIHDFSNMEIRENEPRFDILMKILRPDDQFDVMCEYT